MWFQSIYGIILPTMAALLLLVQIQSALLYPNALMTHTFFVSLIRLATFRQHSKYIPVAQFEVPQRINCIVLC